MVDTAKRPTLRERAQEGARRSLCLHDRTDGFCGGDNPECRHCHRLGNQIGVDVLRHIRPTIQRLLVAKMGATGILTVSDVLAVVDEAIG